MKVSTPVIGIINWVNREGLYRVSKYIVGTFEFMTAVRVVSHYWGFNCGIITPPRCRHIDNLCKQFSVEEKRFWQTRFTKKVWTHCLMMSRGVVFWDIVSNIISTWSPVDQKLVLFHPVSDPVESHINCFAPLLLHCAFEEAYRCFIVHLHRSRWLGVAHFC